MKRIIAIVCLFLSISFLSGCATMRVVHTKDFPLKTPLPKTLVVGDISLGEKVKLPQEEIKKGKEILYATFEKELPNFKISMDAPDGEDYLIVKTKIMLIRKSNPGVLLVPTFALLGTSACSLEITLSLYQKSTPGEEIEIFKVSPLAKGSIIAGGLLSGRYNAYYHHLEITAEKLSATIKKQD